MYKKSDIQLDHAIRELSESFTNILVNQLQLFTDLCIEHGSVSPSVMKEVINEYSIITRVNGLKVKKTRSGDNVIIGGSTRGKKTPSLPPIEKDYSIPEKVVDHRRELNPEEIKFTEISFKTESDNEEKSIVIIENLQFDDEFFPEVDSSFFIISAVDPFSQPQRRRDLTDNDIDLLDDIGLDHKHF